MKTSILNLGKALSKENQKQINGGSSDCRRMERCSSNSDCGPNDCVLICVVGRCRAY
ncbi:hypothetical protein [uncultured Tenacibaculum sp.]|uniref:hypothetical protein n=1 Tax=uncultured Tenacibaculum sp. TaxID=174713 RepID=UPI002625AE78|nr:hypothetical protein [uncultured Tenacibaculum sp.]